MGGRVDVVRGVLHAAGGAPRLFRAARRAGAGRRRSLAVVVTSALALLLALRRAAGVPGRQNAVRHFAWQALLTARHGPAVAQALAAAQEGGSTRRRDSRVDDRNNRAGQAYGAAHAAELADAPLLRALGHAVDAGLASWAAGELASVRPRAARAAAARRRRGSRGRATPRTRP